MCWGDWMPSIRKLCAVVTAMTIMTAVGSVWADEWPNHPISVVIPFASGTTDETIARTVLDPAGSQIGANFVLENRPGGGGTVGIASVAKAPADGYTLLLANSTMTAAVMLHKSLPYDTVRDLQPVAMFGGEPSMLMAAPGKGYANLTDLLAAAKAQPGSLKFGSVGVGSASYIAGERFVQLAGLEVTHVSYSGAAEALTDLAAGRIDFYFVPVTPALPLITQGKAVPLAISTPNRLQSLSGLPTLTESGYALPSYLSWCGLAAPAKTPPGIVDKINSAVGKMLELPAVRTKLLRTGYVPTALTPQQFGNFISDEVAAMVRLGKQAHIEPLD